MTLISSFFREIICLGVSSLEKQKIHENMQKKLSNNPFITNPFFILINIILLLIVLFSFVFVYKFYKQKNLPGTLSLKEERILQNFFREIMVNESGVYTLFGSKPMTKVMLLPDQYSNTDEMLEEFAKLTQHIDPKEIIWKEDYLREGWVLWAQFQKSMIFFSIRYC